MKKVYLFAFVSIALFAFSVFNFQNGETYDLTVEVNGLQNSKRVVQFALYNKDRTIPDEHYEHFTS